MHFTRCTPSDVRIAIDYASRVGGYELEWSETSQNDASFRGRILPTSSYVKGARRSASGRRLRAACWHAHRDVLAALFEMVPTARVQTSMADYNGREGFRTAFERTRFTDVGSMAQPAQFDQLCDCEA